MRPFNLLQWTGCLIVSLSLAGGLVACSDAANSDPDAGVGHVDSDAIDAAGVGAQLYVANTEFTFSTVHTGDFDSRTLIVGNLGGQPLTVTGFTFTGPGHTWFSVLDADTGAPLVLPVVILGKETRPWLVRFEPGLPGAFEVELAVESSAGSSTIPISAIADTLPPQDSCIITKTTSISFGLVAVGTEATELVTLQGCPERLIVITGLALSPDSPDGVSFAPSADGPPLPTAEAPLYLEPGDVVSVALVYAPPAPANPIGTALDGEVLISIGGRPTPDRVPFAGQPIVTPGTPPEVCATLSPTGCALAIGSIEEGTEVRPLTTLHLHADASCSPTGSIGTRKWTVEQPDGSVSLLIPSAAFPNPSFEANVVGTYTFRLEVTDGQGKPGCATWQEVVHVQPVDTIHVEVTWTTPDDPDQTDEGSEAGSDLDLHFAHLNYAVGSGIDLDGDGKEDPWFHQPYDAFWFNAHPNWGTFNPIVDDDPSIDRDDTDGAGPEIATVGQPQGGVSYLIGVHYWSDHGFGKSIARVRLFLHGVLVGTYEQVLSQLDMWCVAQIDWPSETITPCVDAQGAPRVTPNYKNPQFIPN